MSKRMLQQFDIEITIDAVAALYFSCCWNWHSSVLQFVIVMLNSSFFSNNIFRACWLKGRKIAALVTTYKISLIAVTLA